MKPRYKLSVLLVDPDVVPPEYGLYLLKPDGRVFKFLMQGRQRECVKQRDLYRLVAKMLHYPASPTRDAP